MFAIEQGETGPTLTRWGHALSTTVGSRLRGVVIMSPHWMSRSPAVMTTAQPYGPYISLDGLHPTAEGSRILADAAAVALNRTYRLGIPTSTGPLAYLANR